MTTKNVLRFPSDRSRTHPAWKEIFGTAFNFTRKNIRLERESVTNQCHHGAVISIDGQQHSLFYVERWRYECLVLRLEIHVILMANARGVRRCKKKKNMRTNILVAA